MSRAAHDRPEPPPDESGPISTEATARSGASGSGANGSAARYAASGRHKNGESPGRILSPTRSEKTWVDIDARCASGLGIVWLVLGAVSSLLGVWLANPSLFAFGLVLVSIPFAVFWSLRQVARGLSLSRIAPARVHEGVEVAVELRLENRSSWTCFFPRVSEIFPPEIHAQKDLIFTDRLLAGETASVRYVGYAILPRGIYKIGPSVLRVSDPFGWFEIRRELEPRGELVVYPSLHELAPLERGGDAVSAVMENLTASEIGDEDEFRGVREYRRGDSPRRIHWPLTARHRMPVVKEFHPVVTGDLHIVLDLQRHAVAGLGRTSTIETAIRITGSLSHRSLRLGHRVEVIAGSDPDLSVPLAGGPNQINAILDRLVILRSQDTLVLDEWLGDALGALPRGTSALVFIAPYLFREGAWLEAIAQATGRGLRVIAIVFDERTYAQIWAGADAKLSLSQVLTGLRRAGAIPIHVPCASELEAIFAAEREAS